MKQPKIIYFMYFFMFIIFLSPNFHIVILVSYIFTNFSINILKKRSGLIFYSQVIDLCELSDSLVLAEGIIFLE